MQSYRYNLPGLILLPLLLLTACDPVPPPKPTVAEEGERSQTKGLEAAGMVGYDGKAVRKTVDTTLDKGEQHNEQLNQTLKDAGNQ